MQIIKGPIFAESHTADTKGQHRKAMLYAICFTVFVAIVYVVISHRDFSQGFLKSKEDIKPVASFVGGIGSSVKEKINIIPMSTKIPISEKSSQSN